MHGVTNVQLTPYVRSKDRSLWHWSSMELDAFKDVKRDARNLASALKCSFAQLLDLQGWIQDNPEEIKPSTFSLSLKRGGVTNMQVQQTCVAMFGLYYNQVKRLFNEYSKRDNNLYSTKVLINIVIYFVSQP